MKIRKGFVSNSSSSSFVCDVCGEDESGWDLCLSETGMFECTNGHTICKSHKIAIPNEEIEDVYEVDPKFCPICNFMEITDSNLSKYLLKKFNLTKEDVRKEIKNTFKDYDAFWDYLK